jgi:predicted NBD/HSP70 family sugar kinase
MNLLNLKKVIIGGGVAMSYDLFENEMKRTAYDMIYNKANENYIIEKTALTYDAALIGAGALVFTHI